MRRGSSSLSSFWPTISEIGAGTAGHSPTPTLLLTTKPSPRSWNGVNAQGGNLRVVTLSLNWDRLVKWVSEAKTWHIRHSNIQGRSRLSYEPVMKIFYFMIKQYISNLIWVMIICSNCYQRQLYLLQICFICRCKGQGNHAGGYWHDHGGDGCGWWNTEIPTVQSIVLCNRGFGVVQRNQGRNYGVKWTLLFEGPKYSISIIYYALMTLKFITLVAENEGSRRFHNHGPG